MSLLTNATVVCPRCKHPLAGEVAICSECGTKLRLEVVPVGYARLGKSWLVVVSAAFAVVCLSAYLNLVHTKLVTSYTETQSLLIEASADQVNKAILEAKNSPSALPPLIAREKLAVGLRTLIVRVEPDEVLRAFGQPILLIIVLANTAGFVVVVVVTRRNVFASGWCAASSLRLLELVLYVQAATTLVPCYESVRSWV